MVYLEALFNTLVINAYGGKDVAILDTPGAYIHTETPREK